MNNPRSMKTEFDKLSSLFCDAWYSHELSRNVVNVVLLGKTCPRSHHAKKCIDNERWRFPTSSTILADSWGFSAVCEIVDQS